MPDAQLDRTIASEVARFLAAEGLSVLAEGTSAPAGLRLTAIGTIADVALENPLLELPLRNNAVGVDERFASSGPDELFSRSDWDMALVISPWKAHVAGDCDELMLLALATGVVDTIVRSGSRTFGLNTNGHAAGAAIAALYGGEGPQRVLVAGSGASATSVVAGLRVRWPATAIFVIGRSAERVDEIIGRFEGVTAADQAEAAVADLVVHATSVGEVDDSAQLGFELGAALRPGVRFFDLTNRVSRLQIEAIGSGCTVMSGSVMQRLTNEMRVAALVGLLSTSPPGHVAPSKGR